MREFKDERGTITNILQEPCGNVAYITSKRGTVRSNHWHKEDSHWIFVVSGSVQYSQRDLDGKNVTHEVYTAGERFFTPARVVHRVTFLEDSAIVSMSKNPQTEDHHAADCIPEAFVK